MRKGEAERNTRPSAEFDGGAMIRRELGGVDDRDEEDGGSCEEEREGRKT